MASYAGYVRREGKDQVDLGKELGKASAKVGVAHMAEQTRRKGLSKIGSEGMQQLENIEEHADQGVNDWLQGSVTTLKTQIYDEFQLLKKGKINDNEYRQRMSNLSDSWKKFSIVAQNWNKDTEEVITGVNNGTFSKLSSALLGKKNNITNFEATKLTMDTNGNLVLNEYVTDQYLIDNPNTKLKLGEMVPGSTQQLAGLVDPQNVISDKWDVAEQLGSITRDIEAYETIIDEDGNWISNDLEGQARFKTIISDGINVTTSNDRTLANSMTAMDSNHDYYYNDDQQEKQIGEYMATGAAKIKIDRRASELHAEAVKAKTAGYSMAQATIDAEKEELGHATLLQISLKTTKGITEPQFENIITAKKAMTIKYRVYNEVSGEFEDKVKEVKANEKFDIGSIQKQNQIANLAQGIKDYAGRTLKGNSQTVSQKDRWKAKIDKDKLSLKEKAALAKKKASTPNYYATSMRLAGSTPGSKNDDALEDLIKGDDDIIDADVVTINGKQVLKITKIDEDGNKSVESIKYVYDKDGTTINREKTARRINKATYKGDDQSKADKAFDDALEVHGAYKDDEDDAYTKVGLEQNYVNVLEQDDQTSYSVPERDSDGKIILDDDGNPTMKEIGQGDMINNITIDAGNKSHVLTANYLEDVANIPKGAYVIDEDGNNQIIKVLKKGGDANVPSDWKTYTFTIDYSDDDEKLAKHNKRTKMALMSATKYYHHGEPGVADHTETPDEEEVDLDPEKE